MEKVKQIFNRKDFDYQKLFSQYMEIRICKILDKSYCELKSAIKIKKKKKNLKIEK